MPTTRSTLAPEDDPPAPRRDGLDVFPRAPGFIDEPRTVTYIPCNTPEPRPATRGPAARPTLRLDGANPGDPHPGSEATILHPNLLSQG